MKLVVSFLLTVITASITFSQTSGPWKLAYKDDSVTVWIDTTQTVKKDKSYNTTLRWTYASDIRIDGRRMYRSMVEEVMVQCSPAKTKAVSGTAFDVKGRVVSSYTSSAAEVNNMSWRARKKGTAGAKAYEGVCKILKNT